MIKRVDEPFETITKAIFEREIKKKGIQCLFSKKKEEESNEIIKVQSVIFFLLKEKNKRKITNVLCNINNLPFIIKKMY